MSKKYTVETLIYVLVVGFGIGFFISSVLFVEKLDEHKKYQWDQKTLQPGREPEVIKEDDHTADCFQYFVKDNLRQLGLKF